MVTDTEAGDEEMQKENSWYFWSRHSATLGDHHCGNESITTVYAVKTAIGRTSCKGSLISDTVLKLCFQTQITVSLCY